MKLLILRVNRKGVGALDEMSQSGTLIEMNRPPRWSHSTSATHHALKNRGAIEHQIGNAPHKKISGNFGPAIQAETAVQKEKKFTPRHRILRLGRSQLARRFMRTETFMVRLPTPLKVPRKGLASEKSQPFAIFTCRTPQT